jgi:hypothetical protein
MTMFLQLYFLPNVLIPSHTDHPYLPTSFTPRLRTWICLPSNLQPYIRLLIPFFAPAIYDWLYRLTISKHDFSLLHNLHLTSPRSIRPDIMLPHHTQSLPTRRDPQHCEVKDQQNQTHT